MTTVRGLGQATAGGGVLLERDRELETLERIVAAARAGEGVMTLIEGPAGIGKSRLLANAREMANAAGFHVLSARGSDLERELPYGIVRQLFEPLLLEPDGRERVLTGSALAAARVFEPPDADDAVSDGGFGALHGLFWLTANLAVERPLCLSIDDLHWSDRASLRFLAYLERRLEGLGVLITTAARMEDPGAESRLIWEIAQDPAAVSIRLAALSEDAVGEMVRDRLGPEAEGAFCAACHHATGGNPLLLGELLKTMRAEGITPDAAHADAIREIGPRAVARSVLLRLGRLPPDAVAVARAIAVLGDGASLPATASLANLDERSVADATRVLVAAEILRPEPPLGFVHAIVRDAVYHELAVSERELEHERAAKAAGRPRCPARDPRQPRPCGTAARRALGGRRPGASGRTSNAPQRRRECRFVSASRTRGTSTRSGSAATAVLARIRGVACQHPVRQRAPARGARSARRPAPARARCRWPHAGVDVERRGG